MRALREMEGPIGMTRRLLGMILLDGAFISPKDLQEAIELQRKTSAQLGGILVGMGVLSAEDLEAILSVQRECTSPEDTVKAAAGVRELLGELLVRAKRLTSESLGEALAEQHRTGEKLGSILVRRGLLTESELDTVLAFQKRQDGQKKQPSPLRLGEILVRTRVISRAKIEEALRRQRLSRKKIGDILVESGYIRPDQLERGLRLQQKLLTAALVGALSFASVLPVRAFDLPASRTDAKVQIKITAIAKVRTDMKIPRQVHKIFISAADIDRGYVDVPATVLSEGKSDSQAADRLLSEGLDWPFCEATVGAPARELRGIGNGEGLQQPSLSESTGETPHYRFILAENAKPGSYDWPLTVSSQSL